MGRAGLRHMGSVAPGDRKEDDGDKSSSSPQPHPALSADSTRDKLQLLLQPPIKSHFRAILSLAKLWGVRAHPAPSSTTAARCWSDTYFIKTTTPKI